MGWRKTLLRGGPGVLESSTQQGHSQTPWPLSFLSQSSLKSASLMAPFNQKDRARTVCPSCLLGKCLCATPGVHKGPGFPCLFLAFCPKLSSSHGSVHWCSAILGLPVGASCPCPPAAPRPEGDRTQGSASALRFRCSIK